MAAYGTTQNFDKPLAGDTRAAGATKLDLILDSLETTLSAKVTPSGMDINANLSLRSGSTYSGLVDAKKLAMKAQASTLAATDHPVALWADDAGDLWYNNADGDEVQLSNGSSAAGPAGNIATTGSPAYGASSVALQWDAADGYHFFGDGGVPADVYVEALRLVDGAYSIGILAPTLLTNYSLTLPATLPGSTSIVQLSATGAISASPSANVSTAGAVSAGSLAVTAAATVGTTLGVTGLITATAGLTAAVDQNITLSGTGRLIHGTRYAIINGTDFQSSVPSRSHLRTNGRLIHDDLNNTDYYCNLPIFVGLNNTVTIRAIRFNTIHATGTGTREYGFHYGTLADTTQSDVEENLTHNESNQTVAVDLNTDHTLLLARRYFLRWRAAEQDDTLLSVEITYDA